MRLVPRERVQQRIDEQFVQVLFSQITEEIVQGFRIAPQEQLSERICDQSVYISVPLIDVQDIVPLAKEDVVEVVQVTLRKRGQDRFAKQSDAVPPDEEEIAEVRQLMTKLSEFCRACPKLTTFACVLPRGNSRFSFLLCEYRGVARAALENHWKKSLEVICGIASGLPGCLRCFWQFFETTHDTNHGSMGCQAPDPAVPNICTPPCAEDEGNFDVHDSTVIGMLMRNFSFESDIEETSHQQASVKEHSALELLVRLFQGRDLGLRDSFRCVAQDLSLLSCPHKVWCVG